VPWLHIIFGMILSRHVARLSGAAWGLDDSVTSLWAVHEKIAAGTLCRGAICPRLAILATDTGTVVDPMTPDRPLYAAQGIALIPSGTKLRDQVLPEEDWELHYIMIKGRWADALEASPILKEKRVVAMMPGPGQSHHHIREAARLALHRPSHWSWKFLQHLAGFIE
jgi:hypothetical protein